MASTCVECGLPAESGALVNGKTFHPGCFRCKGCSCALAGVQFFAAPSGDVMCGTCIAQTGPKCGKCGTGMTSWVEAAGTKYHKECFNPTSLSVPLAAAGQPMCSGCGKGLIGRYAVKDGKPVCDGCVGPASVGAVCSACAKAVEGGGITVMGAPMHADCFVCGGCRVSMAGKSYVSMNGKAFCDGCATKAEAGVGGGRPYACEACGVTFSATDAITQSMGNSYHPGCFVCSKCKTSLSTTGTTFSVSPAALPVCNACSA
mmetsp:Transcript_33236/g.53527  ORF Transcript_33236/g.53527 Transcript_33236/m.53527 type:complete len:260 (-) Transcript_33236:67-846(-)